MYNSIYVNSPTLSGCDPHSDKLPAKNVFTNITRIHSKSRTLNVICREHKVYLLSKLIGKLPMLK